MAQFILAYHGGGKPSSPDEGMAHRQKWMDWVAGMGDAVINPGTPLGKWKMIGGNGDNIVPIGGFMVIEAADMEAATAMAEGDPFLGMGGTIELAEMMQMPGGK